ncbi:MAG: ribbon-helix-helix protein, CopG family [Candidatus Baltobacteraceae bacterium]
MKIAISLPSDLAAEAEVSRRARGESRSAFFRRAAEATLREEREQTGIAAYVLGYEREPEDATELAAAQSSAAAAWAADPFD